MLTTRWCAIRHTEGNGSINALSNCMYFPHKCNEITTETATTTKTMKTTTTETSIPTQHNYYRIQLKLFIKKCLLLKFQTGISFTFVFYFFTFWSVKLKYNIFSMDRYHSDASFFTNEKNIFNIFCIGSYKTKFMRYISELISIFQDIQHPRAAWKVFF